MLGGIYIEMNSRFGFRLRRLGTKFLVFTRVLPFGNGRILQTQKFGPPSGLVRFAHLLLFENVHRTFSKYPQSCQNPNFESISVYLRFWLIAFCAFCSWL